MKRLIIASAAFTLLAAPVGVALAQDHHDDHPGNTMMMNHNDHPGNSMMMHAAGAHAWHKGDHIGADDWNRGSRVSDYGHYHLSRPPHGYEWRRVDNNYVLAAVAGGVIASVIAASQ
jgi:Ni/Co efflux regulator RcnB